LRHRLLGNWEARYRMHSLLRSRIHLHHA
jgi:hypothetical protein